MIDAVRRRLTPLRDRPIVYVLCILVALGILASAMLWLRVNHETHARLHQLQDVVCGVYVPIANAHAPATSTNLGKTIVIATRHGALALHCPGVRR